MGALFDEFAKSLAGGVSRRQALRRLAAGVVGGLLAAKLGQPEVADAKKGGNGKGGGNGGGGGNSGGGGGQGGANGNPCKAWCKSRFDTDEERTACATAETGACYVCGPRAPKKAKKTLTFCGGVCCDKRNCHEVSDQKVCISVSE